MGKIKKAVVVVLKKQIFFGTDSIALFDLWDLRINSFCNQINTVTTSNITATEKFRTESKRKISKGLETCAKANAKFKVKENAFRPKESEPFCSLRSNQ